MQRLAVACALLVTLALVPGAYSSTPPSGLRGTVTLSPARPVCVEDEPCSKPARGVTLVFRRDGRARATARTSSHGTYRVLLPPGWYGVAAPGYRIGRGVTPPRVRVPTGRIARVDLDIDTGIQ